MRNVLYTVGLCLFVTEVSFCLFWATGCSNNSVTAQPSPAIIVTTWETDNGPGIKIVYDNHPQPYLGNNQYANPQVTFYTSDQVASYRRQLQRAVDQLNEIEDRMMQLEGQDVQQKTEP